MKKLTTEEWTEKAIQKHGTLYDYSESVYTKATEPISIICSKHGTFWCNPRNHINPAAGKCGCPYCAGRYFTTEDWIRRFHMVHADNYTYDKYMYMGVHTKSTITCKKHGDFKQTTNNHRNGQGCPKCAHETAWLGNSYYNPTTATKNNLV